MVSLRQFKQKAAKISSLVKEINTVAIPDSEEVEILEQNYDELYSMILDVAETLDAVISDIEK